MEPSKPWILFSVLAMLILLAILAVFVLAKTKKKHRKPDYYSFFVIGIIWALFGLIPGNNFFFIIGIVFMAVGLSHKKEWKKNRLTWSKLDKDERKVRVIVIVVLGIILLAGIVAFLLAEGCRIS